MGARTPQHRRQRDALSAEKHPAHPHPALFGIRRPTVDELGWLDKAKGSARNTRSAASVPEPDRKAVLRRFGLANQADLDLWKQRACGAGGAGLGDSGDPEAGASSGEDDHWE